MGLSRRARFGAAAAALALVLGIGLVLVLVLDRAPREREVEVRHDSLTAWLTCTSFLQERVPGATLRSAPWAAAQENVRRVDETTYWASGAAAVEGDPGREVRFECVLEWTADGWRLHSLDHVMVPGSASDADAGPAARSAPAAARGRPGGSYPGDGPLV